MDLMASESWVYAQQAVLGDMLIDSKCVPLVIRQTCREDYTGGCAELFLAAEKLFKGGSVVDPVTLAAAMGDGYTKFLAQLMEITPTAANVEQHIKVLHEHSRLAALHAIGTDLIAADNVAAAGEILGRANGALADRHTKRTFTMEESLRLLMDDLIDTRKTYLELPISKLSRELTPEPGDVIVIAGEPSAGKTALMLQFALFMAQFKKVAVFSYETKVRKLIRRTAASLGGLSMDSLKHKTLTDDDSARLAKASMDMLKLDIHFIEASGMTTADIRAECVLNGYEVVFIDYLQLIRNNNPDRYTAVTEISKDLHEIALQLGILMFPLSQIKRDQTGKAPGMHSLRESGQIEQDADVILILSLAKEKDENGKRTPNGQRVLDIAKNKEGERGAMRLDFDGLHQTFRYTPLTVDNIARQQQEIRGKVGKARPTPERPAPQSYEQLPIDTPVPF